MKGLVVFSVVLLLVLAVSAKLVPTPGGLFSEDCVHQVPSGSVVSKLEGGYLAVQSGNNRMLIAPCATPQAIRSKGSLHRQAAQGKRDSGWIVWGESMGTSYTSFNGGWKVPTAPVGTSSQTVFFFTGFEDAAGDEIIQPVLQWGPSEAGGGSYWSVASWWVTSTGSALYSTLAPCVPGDAIWGTMNQTSSGSWTISGSINNGNPTVLSVQNVNPQTMATVTLEAYSIISCGDYPADGTITFTNMALEDQGSTVQPNWQSEIQFTNCNEQVTVQSPDEVTLTY